LGVSTVMITLPGQTSLRFASNASPDYHGPDERKEQNFVSCDGCAREKTMFRCCCKVPALLIVLAAAVPVQAQVVEMHVRSIDDMLTAARYLASLVKAEGKGEGIADAMLMPLELLFPKGGKGLGEVIDSSRPWGVTADWPADSKMPDGGVFYLPVRDAKTFDLRVKKLALPWRPLGNAFYEITVPVGGTFFGR